MASSKAYYQGVEVWVLDTENGSKRARVRTVGGQEIFTDLVGKTSEAFVSTNEIQVIGEK